MADRHEIIVQAVQSDWSVQRRGRLYKMMQGTFRALHSDAIIRVSPYPKKQDGFPDLFGFEFVELANGQDIILFPIHCLVEVKTLVYPTLTEEQKNHLDYCVQIGGRAYVARESGDGYELIGWEIR